MAKTTKAVASAGVWRRVCRNAIVVNDIHSLVEVHQS